MPASLASPKKNLISGFSTTVSISFGIAWVAGNTRVPRPATGKTALRIFMGWHCLAEARLKTIFGSGFATGNKGQYGHAVPTGTALFGKSLTPETHFC